MDPTESNDQTRKGLIEVAPLPRRSHDRAMHLGEKSLCSGDSRAAQALKHKESCDVVRSMLLAYITTRYNGREP